MYKQERLRIEDEEWVRQARRGDGAAFTHLVRRYRDMVYGTAYHLLGNAEDAQDAAQEVFVRAYARLSQLRDLSRFAPWLRRMTVNACTDLHRRRLPYLAHEAAASASSWDSLATRLQVQQALSLLSEKTRLVVTLFYLGGYTHAEIARFLGIPVNTVRSRLQHAKHQLREEMQDMVSETLQHGKPDEQWTRQVVEDALRRGKEAFQSYHRAEAVQHYDAALAALDTLPPGPNSRRLRMETLRQKQTTLFLSQPASRALLREALTLAQETQDQQMQAEILRDLGNSLLSSEPDAAQEHYRQALPLFQEQKDVSGQASCLAALGMSWVVQNNIPTAQEYFSQAEVLFTQTNDPAWAAVCQAMLHLLTAIPAAEFPRLVCWCAICDTLEQTSGQTSFIGQPGYVQTSSQDNTPKGLFLGSVFWQISHLKMFLDASVPVGSSWSGSTFSFGGQPLQASVTVLSKTKQVTTPSGTFADCLLTEQSTTQPRPEQKTQDQSLDARFLCGTVRAWYAPGVGLVQLQVQREDGTEALIQLCEYSVTEASQEYLPLALENTWTYGWTGIPEEYPAKEVYTVTAHKDAQWFLEHWAYAAHPAI